MLLCSSVKLQMLTTDTESAKSFMLLSNVSAHKHQAMYIHIRIVYCSCCVLTSLAGTVEATCAACVAADATRAHCSLEQLITLHTCISASSAATVASEICPSWFTSSSLLYVHQYTVSAVCE
jgi:hypothetical protein